MPCPVDAALIADMLDRYGAALELYAAQWTAAAEDCVQEALVALARQNAPPDNPRAWLYKVVRNRALNSVRADHRRAVHEGMAARLKPTTSAAMDEVELRDALAALADDAREIVVLRIWGQLPWREIADVTGTSSSGAERTYRAALSTLRKLWETGPCAKSRTTRDPSTTE